jgi:hypothetical protein
MGSPLHSDTAITSLTSLSLLGLPTIIFSPAAAVALHFLIMSSSSSGSAQSDAVVQELSPPLSQPSLRAALPVRRGGRKSGSSNWSPAQIEALLDQVQAILPRGQQEWNRVVENYNRVTGESADYDRVHDKFFRLAHTKKPTGKNTKPSYITRAQKLLADIEGRALAADDEEEVEPFDCPPAMSLSDQSDEKAAPSPSPLSIPSRASSPSQSSSSPSHSSSSSPTSQQRSFPSDRNNKKRARTSAEPEVAEAMETLGSALTTAISAQLEQSREEGRLAREQMAQQQQQMAQQQMLMQQQMQMQQQQMQQQMASQQQTMAQLIATLAARH